MGTLLCESIVCPGTLTVVWGRRFRLPTRLLLIILSGAFTAKNPWLRQRLTAVPAQAHAVAAASCLPRDPINRFSALPNEPHWGPPPAVCPRQRGPASA